MLIVALWLFFEGVLGGFWHVLDGLWGCFPHSWDTTILVIG